MAINLMSTSKILFVTLLAVVGYVSPAHAISVNLSSGTAINPNTKAADGGTFSTLGQTTTLDFNTGSATQSSSGGKTPTYTNTYTSNGITFTWQGTAQTPKTAIKNDQYAPPGPPPANQANSSNYLAVFSDESVKITLSSKFGYYGLDWGFADANNQIDFYSGGTAGTKVGSFCSGCTTTGVTNIAALAPGNGTEPSSYVNFNAQTTSDTFDTIVITDIGSTGFETDNHTFRTKAVPVPSSTFGLLALGAMGTWEFCKFNRKPKQKQQLTE